MSKEVDLSFLTENRSSYGPTKAYWMLQGEKWKDQKQSKENKEMAQLED